MGTQTTPRVLLSLAIFIGIFLLLTMGRVNMTVPSMRVTVPDIPDLALPVKVPGIYNLPAPPQSALGHLESVNTHAFARHATAPCILHVAKNLGPNKVYFSAGVPEKGNAPSVGFLWHLDWSLRNLAETGVCSGIDDMLKEEYGNHNYGYGDIKLWLVVGYDPISGYYSVTAYPITQATLKAQLCEWNYFVQIYPKLKPVLCGWE